METADLASPDPDARPARQSSPNNNNHPQIIIIEQAPFPPPMLVRQPMIIAERNPNRNSARGVAFCDIFISTVGLIFTTTIAIIGIVHEVNSPNDSDKGLIITGIVFACIGIPCHLIGMCVACSLLVATNPAKSNQESLRRAKCWVFYNLFLLVLVLLTGSVGSAYGHSLNAFSGNFLMFFLRMCFVCIVVNFIQELRMNEAGVDVVDYVAI